MIRQKKQPTSNNHTMTRFENFQLSSHNFSVLNLPRPCQSTSNVTLLFDLSFPSIIPSLLTFAVTHRMMDKLSLGSLQLFVDHWSFDLVRNGPHVHLNGISFQFNSIQGKRKPYVHEDYHFFIISTLISRNKKRIAILASLFREKNIHHNAHH